MGRGKKDDKLKTPLLDGDSGGSINGGEADEAPVTSGLAAMTIAKEGEDAPVAEKEESSMKRNGLAISFAAMVFVGLGNKLFQKFETKPMRNYPYWLNLWTTFIYIPCSFAYIIPMIIWGSQITAEQRAVPQRKFAVMGCLDAAAGIMQSFATNYIDNGSLLILLQQAAIPMSMIISWLLVRAKYKWFHYAGATIVFGGLAISVAPRLAGGSVSYIWVMVMLASCIPMTLSSVYKEKALGDVDLDAIYLNGWIAVWQFISTLPLAVPAAYASGLTASELFPNLAGGFRCYVGINTVESDMCSTGPFFVNTYLVFNLGYNVLIILILKFGSANVLWLALTVMVPIGNLAFAIPGIPFYNKLRPTDIVGLVVIMCGLLLYRFYDMVRKLITGKTDDEPATPHKKMLYLKGDFLEAGEGLFETMELETVTLKRRDSQIRSSYLSRLGINSAPPPQVSTSGTNHV
eukprot:TRINITY_DN18603_c0_g1_i1.p1 TRINITY_DN18603_c0_g1~~TRINITY_DN18603_c0_g1_i1.p1  ORF type:complete len:461 (+),score=125.04 TRINITY_DN18603_c0_g1_i1:349-1731(+)